MTNFKSDLNLIRKEWYNAFYSGNTEMLDYLEADWFISTNGQKVIYKKHQLRKIDMRPARILPSIERYEYDVVIRFFTTDPTLLSSSSLRGYYIQFFSNQLKTYFFLF